MPWWADMRRWSIPPGAATAGLVVLLVLDVVLVVGALRSTRTSVINTKPRSSATLNATAAGPPGSSTPSVTTGSGATGTAGTPAAAPLQTMLSAVDNQRAWRVSAGSCRSGGATMASTTNGGRTWVKGGLYIRRIVRVDAADGRAGFVIGADVECSAALRSTTDGGRTWGSPGTVGGYWFRDPANPRVVWAPGLTTSQPCAKDAVLDLAILPPNSARVLCPSGSVMSTTKAGSSWTNIGALPGAVALAVAPGSPGQTFVALVGAPGCAGVQILRVGQKVATSCARVALPKDPGQMALSLVKGGGWLSVGPRTLRSTDGLVTWSVS